jgi:hypothetical protein
MTEEISSTGQDGKAGCVGYEQIVEEGGSTLSVEIGGGSRIRGN